MARYIFFVILINCFSNVNKVHAAENPPEGNQNYKLDKYKIDTPLNEIVAIKEHNLPEDNLVSLQNGGKAISGTTNCKHPIDIEITRARVIEILTKKEIPIVFNQKRDNNLLILTKPEEDNTGIKFYSFNAQMFNCPGTSCSIKIKSNVISIERVQGKQIFEMRMAKYKDDRISGLLLDSMNDSFVKCGE
jgi:hypothetical protein